MATVTLRPASNNSVQHNPIGATNNWECVDDITSDDDTTYVFYTNDSATDHYNAESNTIGASDTINSVTIYAVAKLITARLAERSIEMTVSSTVVGGANPLTSSYATYSYTTTTNPTTGVAWTKSNIDSLVFGFRTTSALSGRGYITQSYVIVDYTPAASSSALMLSLD